MPLHVEIDEPEGGDQTAPQGASRATDDPAAAGSVEAPDFRPTVVFSHGYCLTLHSWTFQRDALRAAGYRVVLWDQRGHGRSGSGERSTYTLDQLGDDLARVIAAAAPDGPLVLIGHSMGGMTVLDLAATHPELVAERVAGVGFVSTSTGPLAELTLGMIPPVGRALYRVAPSGANRLVPGQHLVDAVVRVGGLPVRAFVRWGSFGRRVPREVLRLTTDMLMGTRMDVVAAFMPAFATVDKGAALQAIQGVPAVVVHGDTDRLIPVDHGTRLVAALPGAREITIEGGGHIVMLECPDRVNEALLDLMRRAHATWTFSGR